MDQCLFPFISSIQGVIFNMNYHTKKKQLCSVSDDRSIRLWSVDVGSLGKSDHETITSDAVCVLYGHTARVWDCKLLDDVIVSIGEVRTRRKQHLDKAYFRFQCGV